MHNDSEDCAFNIFYIAGTGPDQWDNSAYCFIEGKTKVSRIEQGYRLSAHQAKYSALREVVWYLPPRSDAIVLTDSTLLFREFNGDYRAVDETLQDIADTTRLTIWDKKLSITVEKIRRDRNPAWLLLAQSGAR
jgi:hypothetical protein